MKWCSLINCNGCVSLDIFKSFGLHTGSALDNISFGHSMFTNLDSIGSDVGKRPMGFAIATSERPTEY